MNVVDKAFQTQLKNIETRTGKTLAALYALIRKSGLARHGEIRDMLKQNLGMGHGDANTLAKYYLDGADAAPTAAPGGKAAPADATAALYTGAKAPLRPLHDRVMAAIEKFGDFEIAPKKTYLSLRRKKQFAMVGPGTKGRLEIGINMKDVPGTDRLVAQPAGGMCQYKVWLTAAGEVDRELIGWLKRAYEASK